LSNLETITDVRFTPRMVSYHLVYPKNLIQLLQINQQKIPITTRSQSLQYLAHPQNYFVRIHLFFWVIPADKNFCIPVVRTSLVVLFGIWLILICFIFSVHYCIQALGKYGPSGCTTKIY